MAEAVNGREAIDLFRLHQPCVTLIDLSMPHVNGIQAIQAICREFPHARIVLLANYMAETDEAQARQAGATACLLKDVPIQELLAAIRAAACAPA